MSCSGWPGALYDTIMVKEVEQCCDNLIDKIHKQVIDNIDWFHSYSYAFFLYELGDEEKFKEYCDHIYDDEIEFHFNHMHVEAWSLLDYFTIVTRNKIKPEFRKHLERFVLHDRIKQMFDADFIQYENGNFGMVVKNQIK